MILTHLIIFHPPDLKRLVTEPFYLHLFGHGGEVGRGCGEMGGDFVVGARGGRQDQITPGAEPAEAGGQVHRRTEIIETVVLVDGEAWAAVDPGLERERL